MIRTPTRPARRLLVLLAAVAVLLLAGAGGGYAWAGRYDPLRSAGFAGPVPEQLQRLSDPGVEPHRIVGRPGTEVRLQFGVRNTGPVAVTVDGIEPGSSIVSSSWSEYRFVPGGLVNGEPTPERPFPARIPAHRTFRLTVTVRQPDCAAAGVRSDSLGPVPVRWHVLGRHHVTGVQLAGPDPYLTFCEPH